MNRILESKTLPVDDSLTKVRFFSKMFLLIFIFKGIPKVEIESEITAYESPFELPESSV